MMNVFRFIGFAFCLFTLCLFTLSCTIAQEVAQNVLPSQVLQNTGSVSDIDYARRMVDGIHRFLDAQTLEFERNQESFFQRDFSSVEAYNASLAPNRQRLAFVIGARDARKSFVSPELCATLETPAQRWKDETGSVYFIRIPVFEDFSTEAVLFEPAVENVTRAIILLPDADTTPEVMLAQHLQKYPESRTARIVAMTVVSRRVESYRQARLSQREYVYRSAFVMGRHIIGYEIQAVFAVLDWLRQDAKTSAAPIAVFGREDGAMLAFYAAALDTRITETHLTGYFANRARLWEQPIDRNVFGLLEQFGDAQLAMMVFPRKLVIDDGDVRKAVMDRGTGGGPGQLRPVDSQSERARLAAILDSTADAKNLMDGEAWPVWLPAQKRETITPPPYARPEAQQRASQQRIVAAMQAHTQHLLEHSSQTRDTFMRHLDTDSAAKFAESQVGYRDYFAKEIIGEFSLPLKNPNPRVTPFMKNEFFTGYEVVLDVYDDVIAYGLLLVPHNIPEGEKRPVVVTQTGLEARAMNVLAEQDRPNFGKQNSYRGYGSLLAQRGYIVFSPQNIYIFKDDFRQLQRKLNPLKKTLYSIMVPQNRQIVRWLASRPDVDAGRIAYYGLSYGGKSAMRIPALVPEYCLSICSADFNEWIVKNASLQPFSYLYKNEYEIFEWDLGNTFNYAEMAALIAPRPFMVERGQHDSVGRDEYVAFEYAKVRYLYQARLKLPDRTEIEFFPGGHYIHGVKTFEFLDRFLQPSPPDPRE